ncbi:MAG: hypothetical protein ACE5HQ_07485 [Gemmatimonadota bacterium]
MRIGFLAEKRRSLPNLVTRHAARGRFLREVDFQGVAILDRWRREEARLVGNRPGAGKFWVSSFAADSPSSALLVLLPAHAGTNPLELWKVDLERGAVVARRAFPNELWAWSIATGGGKLFTLDGPTGTVFEADLAENGLHDAARD